MADCYSMCTQTSAECMQNNIQIAKSTALITAEFAKGYLTGVINYEAVLKNTGALAVSFANGMCGSIIYDQTVNPEDLLPNEYGEFIDWDENQQKYEDDGQIPEDYDYSEQFNDEEEYDWSDFMAQWDADEEENSLQVRTTYDFFEDLIDFN